MRQDDRTAEALWTVKPVPMTLSSRIARGDATVVATALNHGLMDIGRSLWQRRRLRVFQDRSSLAAAASLSEALTSALEQSRYFVLIATPGAAASDWVNQELQAWISLGRLDHLLVIVADGEWYWNGAQSTFEDGPDNAIPQAVRVAAKAEPLIVDGRFSWPEGRNPLRDPRVCDVVAMLAAPITGRPKDDLVGDELRAYRRRKRLAISTILALCLLAAALGIVSIVALGSRSEALRQRDSARALALAASSRDLLDENPALAMALAVMSSTRSDELLPQSTAALVEARAAFADRSAQQVATPLFGHILGVFAVRVQRQWQVPCDRGRQYRSAIVGSREQNTSW